MTRTLATGIEVLDRKLDGGIPAGRVVALSAAPVSQSELFLYEMATPRDTVYLSTERPAAEVRSCLQQTETPMDGIEIRRLDPVDPIEDASGIVEDLPEASTLIVDPMRLLERTEPDRYREFLNEVKTVTGETGSLTILHCIEGRDVPGQRDRTEYLADIIFSLTTTIRGGSVKNDLAIPKFRGGQALSDAINLDLTADVTIDVSRKIA